MSGDRSYKHNPISPEVVERDEYEAQLFGFSVRDYRVDNFELVNDSIVLEATNFNKRLAELIPNKTKEYKAKFKAINKKICDEIIESCQPKVEGINDVIKKEFTIPENVILLDDMQYMNIPTSEEVKQVTEECEQLEKTVNENAYFIRALGAELDSYGELKEMCQQREFMIAKAENLLNRKLDVNVLQNAVKMINSIK